MQNFLVKEDVNFEQMCEDFIKQTFGEDRDISYEVSYYDENLGSPCYSEFIFVEVIFNSYKWINGLGDEVSETVAIEFENKGLQPFYIDGKFKTMEVYEAISWHYPQKADTIYGIQKEDLNNKFYDYMTNC